MALQQIFNGKNERKFENLSVFGSELKLTLKQSPSEYKCLFSRNVRLALLLQ